MSQSYGQYCPLSLAVELLAQRWTLLVISRLVDGCSRFNEIQRGVPRMSPSLLSKRLRELERAGLVESRRSRRSTGREYLLTQAGRELEPLIDTLAVWGQRWARDMSPDDLDPAFLVWSMHLRIDTRAMPAGRTVLEFELTGRPEDSERFWLVHEDGKVEMCLKDPGHDVDLLVRSDLLVFVEAWRGMRDLRGEIRTRRIRLFGPPELQRRFPDWLLLSALAPYQRQRPGRERRLSRVRSRQSEPAERAVAG
jgi:DNA-binding HxlR family transcriptional regulator